MYLPICGPKQAKASLLQTVFRWGVAALVFLFIGCRRAPARSSALVNDPATENAKAYLRLEARERDVDRTVWAREIEAEAYEDSWIHLWDNLNRGTNPIAVWQSFFPGVPDLPEVRSHQALSWQIEEILLGSPSRTDPKQAASQWKALLEQWSQGGWRLERSEWHLTDQAPAQPPLHPRSTISFRLPLYRLEPIERVLITGHLEVDWETGDPPVAPIAIRVTDAQVLHHAGPTAFQLRQESVLPPGDSQFGDPLLAIDWDGDGATDFITVGSHQVWRNQLAPRPDAGMSRQLVPEVLEFLPKAAVWAAAVMDVDGDGIADLILAGNAGLYFLPGKMGGGFVSESPRLVWSAPTPLRHPQVLAVGDIDGDGHPEIWIAQYKLPYLGGQFPTPYDDANDGFPAYLLHRETSKGQVAYRDITAASGLAAKRFRRAYSASFIDLAQRGIADLIQVSDFGGLDLFHGDNSGHFSDFTESLGDKRHAFGMSHLIADFNHDGLPDVLMIGMNSPVAARLNRFALARSGSSASIASREAMTRGNRLFLSDNRNPGRWIPVEDPYLKPLAETGWSWGAGWADFANDRQSELVVAAGHETQASALDYERQFWCHDIDVGTSTNDPVADFYFRSATGRRRASQASYGGWQYNSFVFQAATNHWIEAGWLLGLTFPADCRNLLVDDFDGDGRLDVVMLTEEAWPVPQRRLLVFHNELPNSGHWIGIRLDSNQQSAVGARVVVEDSAGLQTLWIVSGDGYRSQAASAAHFGLGTNELRGVTVHWANGRTTRLEHPLLDRWQSVNQ